MTAEEARPRPERLPFALAEHERGRTADELWEDAIARHARDGRARRRRRPGTRSSREYDQYSLYEFLEAARACRRARSSTTRVMNFLEADMHNACRRGPARGPRRRVRRHAGDRRRHGPAAERVLRPSCRTASGSAPRCTRSTRTPDSVTVHYKTEAGPLRGRRRLRDRAPSRSRCCARSRRCTPFSHDKQRAIRQLNYHASTKILFQVRRPVLGGRGRDLRRRRR